MYPPPPPRRFSSRLSLGNRSFPTLLLEELHTDSRGYEPEDQRQARGFSSIFKCQHFPISERRQMVADSDPSRKRNIPIPYVRKSSTVKQRTSEKQPYATGWHCALPEFRHTGPPGGAFILGRQKGKACYCATSIGLHRGAF